MLWKTLLVILLLAPIAHAEEWTKTYTTNGMPQLRVSTSEANIHVMTWDKQSIEARVLTRNWKVGERGLKILDQQIGDAIELKVLFPFVLFNTSHRSVDIEIRLPQQQAKLRLLTGDGNIEVKGIKGEINLVSGDGHQQVEDVDGILRAASGDGRINASGRFDILAIRSGDGGAEVTASNGSRMMAGWSLRAGDGRLILHLPASFAADVDLHSNDGRIELNLPVTVSGRVGKRIRGRINNGGELLTVRTGDGSIHLEKL